MHTKRNLKSEITQYTNFKYMFGPNGQMWYPMAIWLFKVQEQVKNPLFWYNKYTYVIYDAVSRPFSTLCQVDHLNFSELDCLDSNNYYIWWHQQNILVWSET